MSDPFVFLNHGLLTAFTSVSFGTVDAGGVSASKYADLWYRKDTPGGNSGTFWMHGTAYNSALLRYVDSGIPAIDRKWIQARVVGLVNPLNVVQELFGIGPWTSIGANGGDLELPPIAGNCAWVIEFRFAPGLSSGAITETPQYAFSADYDDKTTTRTNIIPHLGSGIFTGVGNIGINEWIVKPTVTAAGPILSISNRSLVNAGIRRNIYEEDYTFNATANDGALGVGEEYQALVTQPLAGGNIVVTKGDGATAGESTPPTMPADSLLVDNGIVTIPYGAASVSLAGHAYNSCGLVEVLDGLTVRVNPLRANYPGRPWVWRDPIDFDVDDDATTYLWATSSGTINKTTTQKPDSVGDGLLAKAVAVSGVVTITDLRTFLEPNAIRIQLKWESTESAGSNRAFAFIGVAMSIDRITTHAMVAASGATGQTIFDINIVRAGVTTTIFTNQGGSTETRPMLLAGETFSLNAFPEVTELLPGDIVSIDIDEETTGGTQASMVGVEIVGAPCR